MKQVYFLLFFISTVTIFNGQVPNIEWQSTIGGVNDDYLIVSRETSDGGFILGGYSNSNISGDKTEDSNGDFDYWVVKLNSSGAIEWQNTVGGNGNDYLYDISQTTDGGYFLGGYSNSNISGDKTDNSEGFEDFWVIKLSSTGSIEWQNTIGGEANDQLYTAIQTSDGGYIIGGRSGSDNFGDKTDPTNGLFDYWVLKLDSLGSIVWQNSIGGQGQDQLRSVKETSDGGYILGGYSNSIASGDKTENSNGGYDYWVVKLDSNGNLEWENTIGGSGNDYLFSVIENLSGDFVITGHSNSNISGDKTENTNGLDDFWVLKLNSTGSIVWQNSIGGDSDELSRSVIEVNDGGYLIGGYSNSNISGDITENSNGDFDYWLVKLDDSGLIEYEKSFGGSGLERLIDVYQISDDGFILAGYSDSNATGDKNEDSNGLLDFWMVKLSPETLSIENETISEFKIYPNPTKDILTISSIGLIDTVRITDINGRVVLNEDTRGVIDLEVDMSSLSAGMYFVDVQTSSGIETVKVVKE